MPVARRYGGVHADARRGRQGVAHRTIEEIWYVISGRGRIWRRAGEREEITELTPGVSLAITPGTHFRFRADGQEPLEIVAATMPPWPGESEAYFVPGKWPTTV